MPENLENSAAATFHENIQYLANYHLDIYNKLLAFDTAIENNHYQNRYELIIRDDYFDVLELSTGNYLYNSSSKDYAEIASDSVNFKRDENVFETFKKFPIELETDIFIDIAPTLRHIKTNLDSSAEMLSIKKFIFFGTGLGTHITEIDKKINAQIYLIVEDNIELFKLSLFATKYYEIGQKSELIFSIFDSNEEFEPKANKFLSNRYYYNHYIKYFPMLSHNEEKIKEFHLRVISQSQNLFFYKDILSQYLVPIDYIRQNFNFLNMLVPYTDTSLGKKPVILLAAGPSLQANIKWVKHNQDKFIIVALSSTLNILEQEKITPDIVTHMDAFESSTAHFDRLKSLDFLDNTIFILSARIQKSIVDKLKKDHIFFYENGTSYKQNIGNLSAPCVGSTTYLIFLALGVKEFYLLGLDLALNEKTGSTHSDEHHFSQKLNLDSAKTHNDVMEFSKTVIKTAGNFKEEVFTKPEYQLSIDSINASSVSFKKETQNVYNLNDGAFFKNTITKSISDISIDKFNDINKIDISSELKDAFTQNCSSSITLEEEKLLEAKLKHALKLKDSVIAQRNYYFNTHNEFLGSLTMLTSRLTNDSSINGYDLSFILQEYFKYIYTFIFDFFNTKDLTNIDAHIQEINELLCKALLRILDEYTQKL
ncbi:motility associated factor glycosyltransferase family protein [Sulfurimonas sp.]